MTCNANVKMMFRMMNNSKQFDGIVSKFIANRKHHCTNRGSQSVDPGKKTALRLAHSRTKAQIVVWIEKKKRTCGADESCICGFALAHFSPQAAEEFSPQEHKVLVVDLVCSANQKGKALVDALEKFAKEQHNVDNIMIAARASTTQLKNMFRAKGFKRVANACIPPSKASAAVLERLDKSKKLEHSSSDPSPKGAWMSKCIAHESNARKRATPPAKPSTKRRRATPAATS